MDSKTEAKTTLYIVELGKWGSDISGVLMTADGEALSEHMSSSSGWLRADLTENFGRKERLAERFGDFEVVYIAGGDDLPDAIAHHFNTGEAES